ncbi:Acyl transferase domain-containing protein [Roseovarius lutimaris]|uniref:Phenolphthiocerol/phthiocerol polyketide synthase subunit E n=2 Tax=Roseovarius lutimaris TaxID=1005928 RepID=A0A1I5E8Q7_9RHOB|nr:Acyl transferase domain-containing protein [Roseovarius lutimaris]
MTDDMIPPSADGNDIAIVGMAAHLPGAQTVAQYWENLRSGISSIRKLSEEELLAAGESQHMIRQKNYVPYGAPLDGFEMFDGEFFGFGPKESAILDPQHRRFLETAWEALEDAGHPPENFDDNIGVFAGCGMGSYFYFNLCSNPDLVNDVGMFLLRHTGNDKDFLTTRLSHILDLKGPSLSIQTACSTSLVAVHYAAQSLLNGECDMALAGGVTIELPQKRGYLYKDGEILSPDGQCHAFDHRAQGTVFGSGAGVVVLRRLADALADGDHIWGVIKGTAVNNDGAAKAGYLAPSVDGQAIAVAEAQAIAGVSAETVDYVECHGTGTYLGDPIEVAALTQAFRETTEAVDFCRIGSVKTNIGHLDTAAGVASLIKATLALYHKEMPPSLGYEAANPAIGFDGSPFTVNDRPTPWPRRTHPRRAGVNSLGVGGTNAHAVLQEPPERAASEPGDWPFQLFTLSARTKAALDDGAARLASHLRAHPEQPLADVAWTLKEGRRAFDRRRVVVADSHEAAAALLEKGDPRRVFTHEVLGHDPQVVFMFPGGGAQYAGMARDLYETEPVFAEWMDRGLDLLQPRLDYDIRAIWLPDAAGLAEAQERLKRPSVQLPLIMITEFALAQLWQSWGVTPAALIGHSMGENTAACLAGVMSFEDCIGLVHLRGQLFDEVAPGGMLSVPLAAEALRPWLGDALDLAAVNAPELSVASGPQAELDNLAARLAAEGIEAQRIPIDIAAHSRMLEPILDRFRAYLKSIPLNAPQIPLISNRTGDYMTPEQATDPDYWVGHLRHTVEYASGLGRLAEGGERVFLEVGPGKALSSLAQAHDAISTNQVISTLRHPDDLVPDDEYFMTMLGRMWAVGINIDWDQIWGEARRYRVPLPSYAFQHKPYFIAPGAARSEAAPDWPLRHDDLADWGYRPHWRPKLAEVDLGDETDLAALPTETWLIFEDDAGLAKAIGARLEGAEHTVTYVTPGDGFAALAPGRYALSPERGREGYDQLIRALVAEGRAPTRIAHFWMVTADERHRPGSSFFHRLQEQGFYSLLFLAQAMADEGMPTPLHISAVTSGAAQVKGEALDHPAKATIMGPLRVIPREMPGVTCASLDLTLPDTRRSVPDTLVAQVLEDLLQDPGNRVAALRGARRYEQTYRAHPIPERETPISDGDTVLITGGFGGIGLTLAEDLIRRNNANIVLMSRRALPARDDWPRYLATHGAGDPVARRIAAIERLEGLGGRVMVVTADVCNIEDMSAARDRIEAGFGRVNGVIHAAGVIADAPLLSKGPDSIEDVFTPKIHGTQVLEQVFPDGRLDWLVLFSSTSTVTAPAGQVDYVAANEYLNAYAKSRHGGKTRVLALNWGIWAKVGMAAEAVARQKGEEIAAPRVPVKAPMIDTASHDAEGNRLFHASYSAADTWAFDQHRTKAGQALLPGTGYLELLAEALRAQGEEGAFEVRDLWFLRPFDMPDQGRRDMRLRLARSEAGYDVEVQSDHTLAGRHGWQGNAQAGVSLLPLAPPTPLDLPSIRTRMESWQEAGDTPLTAPQEAHLDFGPRWRVLQATGFGQGEGLAHLRLPEGAMGDLAQGYLLHPALLDIATGWAMNLIEGYAPTHLWVPMSYGSVRVHAPLTGEIYSWVRNAGENHADAATASFDITICDATGRVLVDIHGFAIRRQEAGLALAPPTAQDLEFDPGQSGEAPPLSPAEERLQHNLEQGILPSEGPEAFRRALASGLNQVVVSSLDLAALCAQAEHGAQTPEESGQKFDRPDLDSDFVAPEGEIETRLAEFWSSLLGLETVGAEDSFFDLGGHSLIAVRLFGMIRKAWQVDFPISVLFEAPTIRACAGLIEARIGPQEARSNAPKPSAPERRFTHLVAMHRGEGGPKRPFFLVAGMFGNVLNLRHLAHLLGDDRPFYGLQARGLYGGEAPHDDLVEAARDYIAEMRQIQPHGPYLLGGFSGGGITAYEMAQQLRAAGEEVAAVVMLDTPLPQRRALSRKDRLLIQWQELRARGPLYPLHWARNRIKWEMAKRRPQEAATTTGHQFHDSEIEAAFYRAIARYDLRPWDGPLHLFRPPLVGKWQVSNGLWVNSERAYVLPDNDWTRYAPQVQVTEVPGDHDSMVLEPNVRVLAARIRRAIHAAEADIPPSPVVQRAAE